MNKLVMAFVVISLMVLASAQDNPRIVSLDPIETGTTTVTITIVGNFWEDIGTFLIPNSTFAEDIRVRLIEATDWTNVTITESQISDLAHTIDTNFSTECASGEYGDGDGNCYSINTTIDARIASTTYFVQNLTVLTGILDAGDKNSLNISRDGDTLNISEVGGSPGMIIILNYTEVTSFDSIIFREWYDGSAGHTIHLGLYDYGTGNYEEEYGEITDQDGFSFTIFNVLDSQDHISGGNVSLRLNHDDAGNINHNIFLDYVVLLDGFSTITGEETDPFALHKTGDVALTGNWVAGAFNITTQMFKGLFNWTATSDYLDFDGATLTLNDTKLNEEFNQTAKINSVLTNVAFTNETNIFSVNQNISNNNITSTDCIIFDSGGEICSGS